MIIGCGNSWIKYTWGIWAEMCRSKWYQLHSVSTKCFYIRQGLRLMTRFCSNVGWKWKWSGKCRKSEISKVYQPNVEFLYTYGDKISMTFYTLYLIFFIKADFADKDRKILWIAKDQSTNSSWYIQIRSTWNLFEKISSSAAVAATSEPGKGLLSKKQWEPLRVLLKLAPAQKINHLNLSRRVSDDQKCNFLRTADGHHPSSPQYTSSSPASPSSPPLSFASSSLSLSSSSSSSPHPLQRPFWFCKIIKRGAGRDHWSYHGVKYCNILKRNNNFFVCCCICSKSWAASHCHRHCRTTKERNVCSNGNEQWSINTAWCSSYFLFGTGIIQILLINFSKMPFAEGKSKMILNSNCTFFFFFWKCLNFFFYWNQMWGVSKVCWDVGNQRQIKFVWHPTFLFTYFLSFVKMFTIFRIHMQLGFNENQKFWCKTTFSS